MNISNIDAWNQNTHKLPWSSKLMWVLLKFETLVWGPPHGVSTHWCWLRSCSPPGLGSSSRRFHPLMLAEIMLTPAVSQPSWPGIIAWAGAWHSPLPTPLLSAGFLGSWQGGCCKAPAVLNSFNPTVQGRHFGGCDDALRVPFESLLSELRDFAERVISLEWLQWL